MKLTTKQIIKGLLPPFVAAAAKKLIELVRSTPDPAPSPQNSSEPALHAPGHHGDYASWQDALTAAGGYDAENILAIQRASMRKVRDGEAAYERDSVLFDEVVLFYPMLLGLFYAAAHSGTGLTVLDFGGALGSSYYQNRAMLSHVRLLRWHVVEQPHFVATGQLEFRNGQLDFFETLDDAWTAAEPDVVLLSSVLQYIPDPAALLRDIAARKPRFILIDRTPVLEEGSECIMVQTVPPNIYEASYACRLLAPATIASALAEHYNLRFAFEASVGSPIPARATQAHHRGYFYALRD